MGQGAAGSGTCPAPVMPSLPASYIPVERGRRGQFPERALVRVQPTLYEPVPYTWFPDLPEIPANAPADSAVALVRARLRGVAEH